MMIFVIGRQKESVVVSPLNDGDYCIRGCCLLRLGPWYLTIYFLLMVSFGGPEATEILLDWLVVGYNIRLTYLRPCVCLTERVGGGHSR